MMFDNNPTIDYRISDLQTSAHMLWGDEVYGPKNSLNDYFVNFTVYLWK